MSNITQVSARRRRWRGALLALTLAAGTAAGSAQAAGCGTGCLNGVMDRYLSQMLAHQPQNLPFAATLNARENAVAVTPANSVWQNVAKIRSAQRFTDPVTGQVVQYGTIETNSGALAVLFVRLKVEGRKITESEIVYNNKISPFSSPANLLEPDLIYIAPVPVERRTPRAGMIALVEQYVDAISKHDPAGVPFSPRCDRYASGAKVTNSPDHPANKEGGTCAGAVTHLTGQPVVNLRVAVVDEALGDVVVAFIIPHGERKPPSSTHVSELFKIVDGKIRSIEEFSFGGGFPPDSGFANDDTAGAPPTAQ